MAEDKNKKLVPYPKRDDKVGFLLGIADNSLILAQRLSELTGHGPTFEVDMALTNIALDLFGQVRSYYQYAAELLGDGKSEDDIAFLRTEREYRNTLLVEQPNRDFAHTIGRQFLFDHFHYLFLEKLRLSEDERIAGIARKSIKEVTYHRDFSSGWIKRLGDGTQESHDRMKAAIDELWSYTGELFQNTEADQNMTDGGVGVDLNELKESYLNNVSEVIEEATLEIPDIKYFQDGGKEGIHTEHLGHLLTEMQYMQRTYPDMEW